MDWFSVPQGLHMGGTLNMVFHSRGLVNNTYGLYTILFCLWVALCGHRINWVVKYASVTLKKREAKKQKRERERNNPLWAPLWVCSLGVWTELPWITGPPLQERPEGHSAQWCRGGHVSQRLSRCNAQLLSVRGYWPISCIWDKSEWKSKDNGC